MATTDLHSIIVTQFLMVIDLFNSNGVQPGGSLVIDTQSLESVELVFVSTNSDSGDGQFNFVLREGDTAVYGEHNPVNVDNGDILGNPAIIDNSNGIVRQGYAGKKRYLSGEILVTGATLGLTVGVILFANSPRHAPTPENPILI